MKLAEIASRIAFHLRQFEANPKINRMDKPSRTHAYFLANAWAAGSKVGIKYINYQGDIFLRKAEAEKYLAWLDAGNIGKHWMLEKT
jgi:hypothetical protein